MQKLTNNPYLCRFMKNRLFAIFSMFLLFSSCSNYSRIQKGRDMDAKLDLAIKLYDKGSFYKALPLLEELITVYRGTKKAEKTYYYYAYTNYRLGDFEGAAYDFETFAKTYPSSEFAEECAYMHAYCYYENSPEYNLDQSSTIKAINELQLFADRYPGSTKLEQCNRLIDQLRNKLELKSYSNAQMYYDMESYKAAITSYKNLLHDYPSTQFREEALFRILKSSFLYAENSIDAKKPERYEETIAAYTQFVSAFPESRQKEKADDILAITQKKLSKINSTAKK
jgi:outer membrane protein assembly factor BamD